MAGLLITLSSLFFGGGGVTIDFAMELRGVTNACQKKKLGSKRYEIQILGRIFAMKLLIIRNQIKIFEPPSRTQSKNCTE